MLPGDSPKDDPPLDKTTPPVNDSLTINISEKEKPGK